jgi:hypothetical protein
MKPSDDEEELLLHNMIREGMKQQASLEDYEALEDDGSQYLNDSGDGDAE